MGAPARARVTPYPTASEINRCCPGARRCGTGGFGGAINVPPLTPMSAHDELWQLRQPRTVRLQLRADLNETINDNEDLQELNEKYDLTQKLDDVADDLISELGNAPSALADIGAGVVSSIFAVVTILVMSMFMVSRGRAWLDAAL